MRTNLISSLRTLGLSYVVLGTALMTGAQSSPEILAIVNGKPITAVEVKEFLPPNFDSFRPDQAYAVRKVALENAIIGAILNAEARRRRVSVPMLRRQMTVGRVTITNSRVEEEYKNNARHFGLLSPDEAKERVRLFLGVDEQMKFYRAALAKLRASARVEIRLKAPSSSPVSVTGTGPSDGPESAGVTITMFSDFQCRYCRESQEVLAQVFENYPEDVRLVFRHLPLAGILPGLTPAAAAVCADQQGSFWEFHDAAYTASSLTPATLRRIAAEIELDVDQFEDCIASSAPSTTLTRDVAEARRLGINGTPAFIVNGKLYKGKLEFAHFRELIEAALPPSP